LIMRKKGISDISIKKILIIQTWCIGDILVVTAALKALRQKFPNARIDFLVSDKNRGREVLENNPFVNNVLNSPKKGDSRYLFKRIFLFIRILFANYQLVIDYSGNQDIARYAIILSHAKYRLGFSCAKNAALYNLKAENIKNNYEARRNIDILHMIDIQHKNSPLELYFYIKEQSMKKADGWLFSNNINPEELIIFSPGSKLSSKAWNPYCYAALADAIVEKYDLKIAIINVPNERDAAIIMKNAMKKQACLLEKMTFNEAAAFIKKAKLLICNDGGLNHLSAAVGTPSFAIFWPEGDPQRWSPKGVSGHHYYLHNAEYAKDNMNSRNDTFGIAPEEAFKMVESIFEEIRDSSKSSELLR